MLHFTEQLTTHRHSIEQRAETDQLDMAFVLRLADSYMEHNSIRVNLLVRGGTAHTARRVPRRRHSEQDEADAHSHGSTGPTAPDLRLPWT